MEYIQIITTIALLITILYGIPKIYKEIYIKIMENRDKDLFEEAFGELCNYTYNNIEKAYIDIIYDRCSNGDRCNTVYYIDININFNSKKYSIRIERDALFGYGCMYFAGDGKFYSRKIYNKLWHKRLFNEAIKQNKINERESFLKGFKGE